MSNHTPGPWIIYPATNGSEICAIDWEDGLPIRAGIARVDQYTYGEWLGNARLIAAAPELLEMLMLARDRIESERRSGEFDPLLRDIDDAIEKAKGE